VRISRSEKLSQWFAIFQERKRAREREREEREKREERIERVKTSDSIIILFKKVKKYHPIRVNFQEITRPRKSELATLFGGCTICDIKGEKLRIDVFFH